MSDAITVGQLAARVKSLLQTAPELNGIWVSGEISNYTVSSAGHAYFNLKDQNGVIGCVMFRNALSRLDFRPAGNMKVMVYGGVDFYGPQGRVQFIVQTMRQSGLGDLYLQFEQLKRKLQAEGLFDRTRKRKLPEYPRTIGVVTSPTGAVIHDIITTSATRMPADIVLAPSMVQGEGAAKTIVDGIRLLNRYGVDVIIVARGGGSMEDLWPFNEEIVARAIAASAVPVVSAVGHETDFTISDFVADARAATPTGAAAVILRDRAEASRDVSNAMMRADRAVESVLERMRSEFNVVDARLSPGRALDDLEMRSMHLDELSDRMDRALGDTVAEMRRRYELVDARLSPGRALEGITILRRDVESKLDGASAYAERALEKAFARMDAMGERPDRAMAQSMESRTKDLDALSQHLEGMNPMNVLGRGYSMVTSESGEVVKSVSGVSEGDTLRVKFRDGTAVTKVASKELKR